MKKTLTSYFSAGFTLANRSLDLFALLALLAVVNLLPYLTEANILVFFALSIITFSIYFGFAMSLPVFLTDKQKNKTLTFTTLIATTIKNVKRAILPLIVIFMLSLILFVLLAIFVFSIILSAGGNVTTVSTFLHNNNTQGLRFISVLLLSLFSVFTFSSIYFSLENNGVFSSLKQSVVFSFHHFRFVLIVMVIELLTEGVWEIVNIPFDLSVVGVARTIVREYVTLFIIASSLLYYQTHKQTDLQK